MTVDCDLNDKRKLETMEVGVALVMLQFPNLIIVFRYLKRYLCLYVVQYCNLPKVTRNFDCVCCRIQMV